MRVEQLPAPPLCHLAAGNERGQNLFYSTTTRFVLFKKNPNIGEIDFPPLTLNVGWNLAIAAKECEKLFDPRSINDCTNTEI